ncbi:MAG: CRISPR-associated endoribonuclease Cas6 [Ignavibacteriaceae bacterium]|nr:CRISPR-associated endoribonuclease Cas6 [Ignavibacteriaceae bacterium]NUM70456.1 CRISPR-associated endoribonuclease Cas6 [Ignavibacteriaceae bacterium]
MRLLIRLKAECEFLTLNYNYPLSNAIYNLLRLGSEDFTNFLNEQGLDHSNRRFKLFTFALRFEKFRVVEDKIQFISDNVRLYISSPYVETILRNIVQGNFEKRRIFIDTPTIKSTFKIDGAEVFSNPEFTSEMKFILYSPAVFSRTIFKNDRRKYYYFKPEEMNEINYILNKNTLGKYYALYGDNINKFDRLSVEWDERYVSSKQRITKRILIDEFGPEPLSVVGIQSPFVVKGDPRLIEVAYHCGFGEKNHLGFGYAEVINPETGTTESGEGVPTDELTLRNDNQQSDSASAKES